MSTINKVPANAGAEWLLRGFALLRKAPLALGTLGLIWGLLSLLGVQLMALNASLGLVVQLGLALMGPLLFAGLLWAVHEVENDRPALPAHLLHAVRSERTASVLSTLLPQVIAAVALGVLLLVMVGPIQLQQLAEVMVKLQETAQAGGQPDPELMRSLPVGRLFLWMLLLIAAAIGVSLVTFVAVPEIIFGGRGGLEAMRNSFRACVHNLGAMVVFYLLMLVSLFAITFTVQLLAMMVQLVAGPGIAIWVSNLLMMAVLMPLLAGAVYHAWQQMLGTPEAATTTEVAAPATHFEA